jgi:hypothetical protein
MTIKLPFTETELADIRLSCQRGLEDIAAGRGEPDSDALFERISADVDRLLEAERLHRER